MFWNTGKPHIFQLSELSAEEYFADEALRHSEKQAWRDKNLNTLFEDMKKKNIKFPSPIIPLGNGLYILRPETKDDVKAIVHRYNGKLFPVRGLFKRYTISDLCAMEHDKEYKDFQSAFQKGNFQDSREIFHGLFYGWKWKMGSLLDGYEESWVVDLRKKVDGVYLPPPVKEKSYVPK